MVDARASMKTEKIYTTYLCQHLSDFGIDAVWNFFATSHGKSPCDGIGGTARRVTARTSLQRPKEAIKHHLFKCSTFVQQPLAFLLSNSFSFPKMKYLNYEKHLIQSELKLMAVTVSLW